MSETNSLLELVQVELEERGFELISKQDALEEGAARVAEKPDAVAKVAADVVAVVEVVTVMATGDATDA